MFEEDVKLKDLILAHLRERPLSISGIRGKLDEAGSRLHRLVVSGYLRALADVGILDERDIPPSKVYSLRPGHRELDVYEEMGRAVEASPVARSEQVRFLVAVLSLLFRRPVFREEVKRCGFEDLGLVEWEVATDARQAPRRLLANTAVDLPHNDPAYAPPASYWDEERLTVSLELLMELARGVLHAQPYTMRSRQTTLEGAR